MPADWLAPQGPREGLGHYFDVLRERKWLIVACVVIATLAAGVYAKTATRKYEAQATLLVTPVDGSDPNLLGLGMIPASSDPTRDVSTAASIVTTEAVADRAAKRIPGSTPDKLLADVTAAPLATSNVVAITATSTSAAGAQQTANAFAQAVVADRTDRLHAQLATIIPSLTQRVAALPASERSGQGSLGDRLTALQSLAAAPDPTIHVETLAQLPSGPSFPRTKLSIIVGVIIGLVIGLGAAFALEVLDPRLRREDALRRVYKLPVLARVPHERRHGRTALRPDDVSPAVHEGYRMLRVALGIRDAMRESRTGTTGRSLLVTGSGHSEGKSSSALNLASVIATSGSSVILVEADLRRPSLGTALRFKAPHGVASVLMGELDLEDALVQIDEEGRLRVLLVEPTAQYLAESPLAAGLGDIIEAATQMADYVIVDAPPVTEVSDAVPLARQVDDVLVVARLGSSRVDRLEDLGEILAREGIRPVGILVVGGNRRSGSEYYADPPGGGRGGLLRGRRRERTAPLRA